MKRGRFDRKNICKNRAFSALQNNIAFGRRKSPCIAAVWGRIYAGKSDKESSHVVGKCL